MHRITSSVSFFWRCNFSVLMESTLSREVVSLVIYVCREISRSENFKTSIRRKVFVGSTRHRGKYRRYESESAAAGEWDWTWRTGQRKRQINRGMVPPWLSFSISLLGNTSHCRVINILCTLVSRRRPEDIKGRNEKYNGTVSVDEGLLSSNC